MIDQSLLLVSDRLNAHLAATFSVTEDLLTLSPLTDAEGKPATAARNRLAMFLVNIAQDGIPRGRKPGQPTEVGMAQPIHLDIYFMLAAGHDPDHYGEGIKQLSVALMFFQAHPVLTPQNAPGMPSGVGQLTIEIANLRVEELGQLWGNLGGRYVPSVMFKMRSVVIDASAITRIDPVIRSREGRVSPAGVS